jgi:hypothetical protein
MQHQRMGQAIIAGPIEDTGQLALALVIHTLAGQDGWVYKTGKQLAKLAHLSKNTGYKKLDALEKLGLIERMTEPPYAIRLDQQVVMGAQQLGSLAQQLVLPTKSREYQQLGSLAQQLGSPSPSAYLPKKIKDLKEEEEEKEKIAASPSSPSSTDRVISEAVKKIRKLSISDLPDQPAAQPPAVVEQADLLPAKPKAKRKRAPAENPKDRITENWQPKAETLANLVMKNQLPREFCDALVYEFVTYWRERGTARPGWDSTFITHAKNQWKREQENEQNAEQRKRFTDAAGRPISESQATMRDIFARARDFNPGNWSDDNDIPI